MSGKMAKVGHTFTMKVLKPKKNMYGEILQQSVIIKNTNKSDGVWFDVINDIYKTFIKKYPPVDMLVVGKPLDGGFKTLKEYGSSVDNLKYAEENYFDGAPIEVADKLKGKYYSVKITINY